MIHWKHKIHVCDMCKLNYMSFEGKERENERMCQNEDEKRHESAMFSLGLLCIFVS